MPGKKESTVRDIATAAVAGNREGELEFHEHANIFPLMQGEEFDALVDDIKTRALRTKIVLYEGKILDGRNRYLAMLAAGHTPRKAHFSEYKPLIPSDTPLEYVIRANVLRRHLTGEQKRELIAKLLKMQPEKSDRRIAKMAKVDHHKVGKVRKEEEDVGKIPHVETRTDTKGREQPAKKQKAEDDKVAAPPTKEADQAARAKKEQRKDTRREAFAAECEEFFSWLYSNHPERAHVFHRIETQGAVYVTEFWQAMNRHRAQLKACNVIPGSVSEEHPSGISKCCGAPFVPAEEYAKKESGNGLDPEQSADKRKAEYAALEAEAAS
jgi:hypothetical protein